jgi:hypothetical protein
MRLPAWVLLATLATACTGSDKPGTAAAPTPNRTTADCIGTVSLAASSGQAVVVSDEPQRLAVRSGERVSVRTTGPCGAAVVAAAQQPSKLRRIDSRTLGASGVGETKVLVSVPMCALHSPPLRDCIGGTAPIGVVTVAVEG